MIDRGIRSEAIKRDPFNVMSSMDMSDGLLFALIGVVFALVGVLAVAYASGIIECLGGKRTRRPSAPTISREELMENS